MLLVQRRKSLLQVVVLQVEKFSSVSLYHSCQYLISSHLLRDFDFAAAIEDSSIDFGDFFKGPLPGKFLKLLGYLALSRLGIYIPLAGVNRDAFVGNLDDNSFLSTLDSFSGGGIGRLGICSLGIVPFINAQIVFQLLAQIYPKLQDLQKREGEAGRKKILQYTRYASVGFALVQVILFLYCVHIQKLFHHNFYG